MNYTATITNQETGKTISMVPMPETLPEWVYSQLSDSETTYTTPGHVDDLLDTMSPYDWYDKHNKHIGPDACGINLYYEGEDREANRFHKSNLGMASWARGESDIEYVREISRDTVPDCADGVQCDGQDGEAFLWEHVEPNGTVALEIAFFKDETDEDGEEIGELWTGTKWTSIDGYCYGPGWDD